MTFLEFMKKFPTEKAVVDCDFSEKCIASCRIIVYNICCSIDKKVIKAD